jgi:hypothetical protein
MWRALRNRNRPALAWTYLIGMIVGGLAVLIACWTGR